MLPFRRRLEISERARCGLETIVRVLIGGNTYSNFEIILYRNYRAEVRKYSTDDEAENHLLQARLQDGTAGLGSVVLRCNHMGQRLSLHGVERRWLFSARDVAPQARHWRLLPSSRVDIR